MVFTSFILAFTTSERSWVRGSVANMQPNHAARILELFQNARSLQASVLSSVASTAAEHHAELQQLISDAGFRLPAWEQKQQSPAVAQEAVSKPEPQAPDELQPQVYPISWPRRALVGF